MINKVEDRMLRINEVADILSVCSRTVRRMVQRGELPEPVKMNKRCVAFLTSDINNYIKNIKG